MSSNPGNKWDFFSPTVMKFQKYKYEQISVGHYYCGKHAMANCYGTPKNKNKNEQISVVSFCGKHTAIGAKKRKCSIFFVCLVCILHRPTEAEPFTQTYGTVYTDLRNRSRLSKHCTKPQIDVPKVGHSQIDLPKINLIFKLMCPRCASLFSN